MKDSLMIFENHKVEIINLRGQALFNPYHVGVCLDIDNVTVRRHIQSMSANQVLLLKNSDVQEMNFRKLNNRGENFLTKSGVYKLIFKSNKPEAERFQDWVTDEVLPQIEMTGGYIPVSQNDTDQEILAKSVLISQKTIQNKDVIINNLQSKIQDLEPKAQAYIDMMTAQGYLQFIDVAAILEKNRNALFQLLRSKKVLTKQSRFNVPYGRFRNNGMFKVICAKSKEGYPTSVTMVSPKGLNYIYNLIKKNNLSDQFNLPNELLEVTA